MNKKYILSLIVTILLTVGGIYLFQSTKSTIVDTGYGYDTSSNNQFYSIHDLKNKNLNQGFYSTEGYIVKKYDCPPCPIDSQCKPCMKNNIVISEKNVLIENYNLTDSELMIFVDSSKKFELSKKYKFTVKLLRSKTTGDIVNNFELVESKL